MRMWTPGMTVYDLKPAFQKLLRPLMRALYSSQASPPSSKGPASGIPYKVYAVQAHRYASLWSFLLFTIPARLERFFLTWAVACAVAVLCRKRIEQRSQTFVRIHAFVWASFYACYWSAVSWNF